MLFCFCRLSSQGCCCVDFTTNSLRLTLSDSGVIECCRSGNAMCSLKLAVGYGYFAFQRFWFPRRSGSPRIFLLRCSTAALIIPSIVYMVQIYVLTVSLLAGNTPRRARCVDPGFPKSPSNSPLKFWIGVDGRRVRHSRKRTKMKPNDNADFDSQCLDTIVSKQANSLIAISSSFQHHIQQYVNESFFA